MFDGIKSVPLVASASSNFRIDPNGALGAADFDIMARGEIPWAHLKDKALHVRSLRLVGRYDGVARHLALTTANLDAREARAMLRGDGDFIMVGGKLDRVHAQLAARNITLDMPGIFKEPVGYQSVMLAADYLTGPRQFNITKLAIAAPGFALNGTVALTLNDNGAPGLVAKASIPALPIHTLLHYWPLPVASGARQWMDENVFAGTIGPLIAETNFAPA